MGRARHNSYPVKKPGRTGTRHHGPPTIRLANLPATVRSGRAEPSSADTEFDTGP